MEIIVYGRCIMLSFCDNFIKLLSRNRKPRKEIKEIYNDVQYMIKTKYYIPLASPQEIQASISLLKNVNDPYECIRIIAVSILSEWDKLSSNIKNKEVKKRIAQLRWAIHLLSMGYDPPTAIALFNLASVLNDLIEKGDIYALEEIKKLYRHVKESPSKRARRYEIASLLLDILIGLGFIKYIETDIYGYIISKDLNYILKSKKTFKRYSTTFQSLSFLIFVPHKSLPMKVLPNDATNAIIKAALNTKKVIVAELLLNNDLSLTSFFMDINDYFKNELIKYGLDPGLANTIIKYVSSQILFDIHTIIQYLAYYDVIDIDIVNLFGRNKYIKLVYS